MPSNFDAKAYAAKVRAMDVNALLEEWYVRRWRIDESGVEWDYERISKDELLRRLTGRVDREKLAQDLFHEINAEAPLGLPMEVVKLQCESDANRIADLVESGKLPREGEQR